MPGSIRPVIIALFIACGLMDLIVCPLSLMLIHFIMGNDYPLPPIFYIAWVYSPVFVAGLYIGILNNGKKVLLAAIVGFLSSPISRIIAMGLGARKELNLLNLNHYYGTPIFVLACILGCLISNEIVILRGCGRSNHARDA